MATAIEQLIAEKERVKQLSDEVAEATAQVVANKADIAKLQARIGELEKNKTDADAAHAAAVADLDAKLKAEQDAHGKTRIELEKAQAALANPTVKLAANDGDAKAVAEGGAAAGVGFATKEEALKAYRGIKEPADREAFRKNNKEILGL